MRRILLTAVAGVTAFAMSACSTGAPTTGASPSGPADGAGKKITVWIMEGTNPDASAFFDKVESDFKAKTGAEVDVQMVPWASAHDKFTTAIAGGTTPDVAEIGFTWTPEFAEAGALLDVTDKMKEAGLDKGMVQVATDAGSLDGKVYGAPWYAGVRSFLYNTEIFSKAGIEKPPASWAELQEAVTKIKQTQPDVTPFPVIGAAEFNIYPWIYGAGGDIAKKDGDKFTATLDSPEAQAGLTYFSELATKHDASTAAAITWNEKDALNAFMKGDVGMILSGSWTPATVKAQAADLYPKVGAFPIPGKDGGLAGSVVGGSHLSVFQNSKNPDLAWEFVKMMTTGEQAKAWGKASNFFPCDIAGLDAVLTSDDPLISPFAKQMKEAARTVPVTPAFAKIQAKKTLVNMMQSILTGKADVKTATEAANKEMQDIFNS